MATFLLAVAAAWAFIKLCVLLFFKIKGVKDKSADKQLHEEIERYIVQRELKTRGPKVKENLPTASEDGRARLEADKAKLTRRLADTKGALQQYKAKVRELEAQLDHKTNEIGGDPPPELAEAQRKAVKGVEDEGA